MLSALTNTSKIYIFVQLHENEFKLGAPPRVLATLMLSYSNTNAYLLYYDAHLQCVTNNTQIDRSV